MSTKKSKNSTKRVTSFDPKNLVIESERLNYEGIADILRRDSQVFVENMNKRLNYYAKKRLESLLTGKKVVSYPARYGTKMGYAFYVKDEEQKLIEEKT